jgi:response regulator NasT
MGLRIMLIDENPGRAAILEQALSDCGHQVVSRLTGPADVLGAVKQTEPDVVIADIDSPDRDTLESMGAITRDLPRPIVMFSREGDLRTIERAIRAGVSAYVVNGVAPERIQPVVDVAIARFREFQALRRELQQTKTKLAERKLIDRAKGILMDRRGMREDEAYAALRKLAMDKNKRIAEIAEAIIASAELLG